MFDVHIYIAQDSANPRKSKKTYGYVCECEIKGELRTVEGYGETESTYHETTLIAINQALGRLNQSCKVHIHTEDKFILNMLTNNLDQWAANDFKSTKDKPVEYEGEWRKLWDSKNKQVIFPEHGPHAYKDWLLNEFKKRGEKNEEHIE